MRILDEELDRLLQQTIDQWNIAERRIKKAEQVCANEVVISAIFELRYAGRKIADALALALQSANIDDDEDAKNHIRRYLADALEDCVKAKHDAIDAMIDFVTIWFSEVEEEIGLDELIKYFPNHVILTGKISAIQNKIAESRGERHLGRDGVYDSIEKTEYGEILELYQSMKTSRNRIEISARKHKRTKIISLLAGPVIGVIAILVALIINK